MSSTDVVSQSIDPDVDYLRQEAEREEEEFLREIITVPAVPVEAAAFGTVIETVKITLAQMLSISSRLKEEVAHIRGIHQQKVRGEKSTLNEKDKAEVERLCATDQMIQQREARIRILADAYVRWDARRSRLNRDFEAAKIFEAHSLRLEEIQEERKMRYDAADYDANRRRNS